ncbi:carbohydrate kinase [bacterium]|nr:carbohydrate kinase [bacterium]
MPVWHDVEPSCFTLGIMQQLDLIGLGELLWDCFPDRRLPGGAPANVAFHAQQLGLSAAVATRVGCDPLGDELLSYLQQQGLSTNLVQRDPQHGTGTVTVEPQGTSTRYTFLENSAWDFLAVDATWQAAMATAKAVCFGTLAQRGSVSRSTIHQCLALTQKDCLRVYDINLRPPFYEREWIEASLKLARIVKLNDDEVRVLTSMFGLASPAEEQFAQWLLQTYELELVCITRGAQGALAISANEQAEVQGISITVADTVGAGDAFTAGLIWSRLQHWPLQRGLTLANRIGALVASRAGAMPELHAEIASVIADCSS